MANRKFYSPYSPLTIRYSPASRPKLEIDAGFDFLNVQRRVGAVRGESGGRQIERLGAEAEIIVFALRAPIRRESIFKARAGGPAGPRRARAGGAAENVVQAVIVMRKGNAAFAVDQKAIESDAGASGHRRGPLRVGIDRVADRVVTAAFEPGPVEDALDAEHQRVDLPLGTPRAPR